MKYAPTFNRLGVLDGLRGLAILLVVWYHLRIVSGYALPGAGLADVFARNGYLGVDLFFFLSGFCICYPYARARGEGRLRPSLSEFVRRRARKIVPSYVLALAVFAVVYHARFASSGEEFVHLLAHLTFVHVWFPATFGSLSGPLWTLGVEVQFYVLFVCVSPFVDRYPLAAYACFVAVAVAYRGILAGCGLDTDFGWTNQLPAVLDVFGAGMLAPYALLALARRARLGVTLPACCACAAGLAIIGGFFAADAAHIAAGDDGARRWLNEWRVTFGPLLLAVTLGVALGAPRLSSLAGGGALAWLALVSYNAYLWNLEIAVGLQDAGLPPWAIFWLGAAATLAVSAFVTYRFERPLQRIGFGRVLAAFRRAGTLPDFRRARRAPTGS